jgi:hypothetical protein
VGCKKPVTVAKGMLKYKLDLLGVQEIRWDIGGTEPAGEYTFTRKWERKS